MNVPYGETNPSRSLRGVVFDLDDTLTDNVELELEVWADVVELVAGQLPGVDRGELRRRHLANLEPLYARMLSGELDPLTFQHARITDAMAPWAVPDEVVLAGYVEHKRRMTTEARLAAGAGEAVDAVRAAGLKVGVLTNGMTELQELKLASLGIGDRIDAFAVSEAIGATKPQRAAFDAIAGMLGCAPGELAMIGDNPVNDVMGALDAGFAAALHVHRHAELRTPADAVAVLLGLALARGLLRVQADRDRQVQRRPDDAVLLGVVSGRVALAR